MLTDQNYLAINKRPEAVFLALNVLYPDIPAVYGDLMFTQFSNAAIQEAYAYVPGLQEVNCIALLQVVVKALILGFNAIRVKWAGCWYVVEAHGVLV